MGGNQNDGCDEPVLEEPPGVIDEEINPETPGVGTREDDETSEEIDPETPGVGTKDDETSENNNDPPTLGKMTDQQLPGTGTRYNLRNSRGRSYNHRYAGSDFIVEDENGVVMTMEGTSEVLETPQMSLKAGLRTFGNDGMKAVEKEMKPLHDRDVMIPVHKKSLTPEQCREALAYLIILSANDVERSKGAGVQTVENRGRILPRKTQRLLPSVLRQCS